jgi:hypothetical protein
MPPGLTGHSIGCRAKFREWTVQDYVISDRCQDSETNKGKIGHSTAHNSHLEATRDFSGGMGHQVPDASN